jgi:hypothetical protein
MHVPGRGIDSVLKRPIGALETAQRRIEAAQQRLDMTQQDVHRPSPSQHGQVTICLGIHNSESDSDCDIGHAQEQPHHDTVCN